MAGGVWRQVKIGGGGYCTGIDKSTDETTIVCRNDTAEGALIWNSSSGAWECLFTASSMPSLFREVGKWTGVNELRVAPNNPNRLYMARAGRILRSDNRGRTWTLLSLTWDALYEDSGEVATRFMNQKMAVDPINSDVVYFGTPSGGVYRTFDAGVTWTQISTGTIPACSTTYSGVNPGHPGICFDPTSGSTGGRTNTIYIPVYGGDIYRSTNAGSTFAAITSPLPKVRRAKVDQGGNYWVVGLRSDEGAAELYKWTGSWSANLSPGGAQPDALDGIVIDPTNVNRVIVFRASGEAYVSTDGGANFGSKITFTRTSADIPWLAYTEESYMGLGEVIYVGSEIWQAHGIGVAKTTITGSPASIVWDYNTKGIENLTVTAVVCPPNGSPVTSSWDRAVHVITNPEVYPSFHYPDNQFRHAWDMDYASSDPTFLAYPSLSGSAVSTTKFGFKSTNSGSSWTGFADTAVGATGTIPLQSAGTWIKAGGSVACSTPSNIVVVPANQSMPWRTKDGGASWAECVISGVPTSGDTGFGLTYTAPYKAVAADRVTANTFYAMSYVTQKVYRSTDSGDNWTAMNATGLNASGINISIFAAIKAVPGNAGHLFITGGRTGNLGDANPGSTLLLRSTNSGATWAEIPGFTIREPTAIGFGKAAAGQSYPSIVFAGWLDGVFGLWRSDDSCVSWSNIGTFPAGLLGEIISIDGSKEVYGTWYAAMTGLSYIYRTEAMQYTKL